MLKIKLLTQQNNLSELNKEIFGNQSETFPPSIKREGNLYELLTKEFNKKEKLDEKS